MSLRLPVLPAALPARSVVAVSSRQARTSPRHMVWALPLLAAGLSGLSCSSSRNAAEVEHGALPIVSPYVVGNWSPGVVALFAGGPRPCSGVMVSRGAGTTGAQILTVGSCIPQGFAQSGVGVVFWLNAGLTVPTGAFMSTAYVRHPTLDAALVTLGITIAKGEYQPSLWTGSAPPTVGTRLKSYGYGRADVPPGGTDATAGQQRNTEELVVARDPTGNAYTVGGRALPPHNWFNLGDEGGPTFQFTPPGAYVLTGIHAAISPTRPASSGDVDVSVSALAAWIQSGGQIIGSDAGAEGGAEGGADAGIESGPETGPSGGSIAALPFPCSTNGRWQCPGAFAVSEDGTVVSDVVGWWAPSVGFTDLHPELLVPGLPFYYTGSSISADGTVLAGAVGYFVDLPGPNPRCALGDTICNSNLRDRWVAWSSNPTSSGAFLIPGTTGGPCPPPTVFTQ